MFADTKKAFSGIVNIWGDLSLFPPSDYIRYFKQLFIYENNTKKLNFVFMNYDRK